MAQKVSYSRRICPRRQMQGRAQVPQIMEADLWKPSLLNERLEIPDQIPGQQRRPDHGDE
jgi:hypothetical protein